LLEEVTGTDGAFSEQIVMILGKAESFIAGLPGVRIEEQTSKDLVPS
jgi:hypothetical protein